MIGCDCNAGLSNTNRPNCVPIQGITSSLILVPMVANDGTPNCIDLSLPIPAFADFVNEADSSKRWFPLPAFENVELPKADSLFEEASSGKKAFLRQGVRSFAGELWAEDSTPTFLGKLQKARCVDFGAYIVDVDGNLVGSEIDGKLYPIQIDQASWDAKFAFATDSTTQKIMLGFDFYRLFDESTMYMVTVEEAGIDFTTLKGLIDVNLTVTAITSVTMDVNAELCYGTAFNKIDYVGAGLPSDWVLTNDDLNAPVAIDGVTIVNDGDYIIDFTTAGLGAGVNLTLSVNRVGFIGEVSTITV